MDKYELEDLILKEIREKIPNGSQFIDIFAYNKSVKLDGTFKMSELLHILSVLKKYENDMEKV